LMKEAMNATADKISIGSKNLNPVKKNFLTQYYFPYSIDNDALLYLKTSSRKLPAFYIRHNNGEKKLREKNISIDEQFSYRNGKIVYAAYESHSRWGWKDNSEIKMLDIKTGEQKNITYNSKYFTPDISPDGKKIPVSDLIQHHRASVFYFLMPGCPMCESYTRPINELDKKFSPQGISFFGIFSSDYYSDEEINSFRNDFKVTIPFYRDVDFKLTRTLGATVTPEVFVMDSTAAILYSGSIDNLAYATGKIRMEATEFFLNDALENIIHDKPVAIKATKAYGCIIE